MSRLQKPVRAQRDYDEVVFEGDSDSPSEEAAMPRPIDDNEEDTDMSDEDMNSQIDDEDNPSQDPASEDEEVQSSLRTISFGALATAQDSFSTQNKPSSDPTTSTRTDAEKVSALRSRLAQLKSLKASRKTNSTSDTVIDPHSQNNNTRYRDQPPARSSKHAPTEQTSKRQVSRFRPIVADLSSNPTHTRDPRFTPADLPPSESEKLRRNYAFLSSYRRDELTSLKTALGDLKAAAKKRKSNALTAAEEREKERLMRTINAVENREKAEGKREREREIVRGHRREEREKVKGGKAPFFLKQSEVKRKALTEQWEGMKGRERDKAIKRRRKKISERERRDMPGERRGREG